MTLTTNESCWTCSRRQRIEPCYSTARLTADLHTMLTLTRMRCPDCMQWSRMCPRVQSRAGSRLSARAYERCVPTGGIPEPGPTLRIGIGADQAAGDTSAVVAEVVDALTSVHVVLLALPGRAVDDFLAEPAAAI